MNWRRFNRRFPAPPPTPDGMVWANKIEYATGRRRTVLVRAEELHEACKAIMEEDAPPDPPKPVPDGIGIGRATFK